MIETAAVPLSDRPFPRQLCPMGSTSFTKPRQRLNRLLQALLRHQTRQHRKGRSSGFTLLELLVSIIIGALITILLLGFVVELTKTNQEDAARSQVQQDMQAAMDYIAEDLREAVFVYNGQCLAGNGKPDATSVATFCPGVTDYIPAAMTQNGTMPVLAFWRTQPLPDAVQTACGTNAANLPNDVRSACISGSTYALVVYAVAPRPDNNPASTIWDGNARILRYELNQFPNAATGFADVTVGYFPPLSRPSDSFQQWPYSQNPTTGQFGNQQAARPTNPAFTLVDFADPVGGLNAAGTAPLTPSCAEFAPANDPAAAANALSPRTAANDPITGRAMRGFYACVRGGGMGNAAGAGVNQDVLLTLFGNVSGKPGFPRANNNKNRLSPLQTRVLVRGVLRKVDPT